jgi:hypothetical protein
LNAYGVDRAVMLFGDCRRATALCARLEAAAGLLSETMAGALMLSAAMVANGRASERNGFNIGGFPFLQKSVLMNGRLRDT